MIQKLKQQNGETLIETLIAMLIIVLSVALLCTCVMTATNINKQTKEADAKYRAQLLEVEGRTATTQTKQVQITSTSGNMGIKQVNVTVYGEAANDFISYDYEVSP